MRNFLSVAKMASLVYERENCHGERTKTSLAKTTANCLEKIGQRAITKEKNT